MLERGDEVAMGSTKYWVEYAGNNYFLIDQNGIPLTTSGVHTLKVIRSCHRNMQALSIGAITMLENPLDNLINGNEIALLQRDGTASTDKIIQASVQEYSDVWPPVNCDCDFDSTSIYNRYTHNVRGTWRAKRSHLYLQSRTPIPPVLPAPAPPQNNREDGTFDLFNPFWWYASSEWLITPQINNWTWTSEVTKFSPYGFELENQDRLGRYSAAQYDYNNNLPVAVGNNTEYREIGFDSFEEYNFDNCSNDHFSFEAAIGGVNGVVESSSHTGRKSFNVGPGPNNNVQIIKYLDDCQ